MIFFLNIKKPQLKTLWKLKPEQPNESVAMCDALRNMVIVDRLIFKALIFRFS